MGTSITTVGALLASDLRNIRRDTLLRFLLAYPFVMGLVMRFLIPVVENGLRDTYDIHPLYPLFVSFFGLVTMAGLSGLVIGLLFLDERDEGSLAALQVTPLPMRSYLGYRMALPMIWGVMSVFIMVPLMGIAPFEPWVLLVIGLEASLLGPIFAVAFVSFAANKVQGLAFSKGLSVMLSGPFIAWFVPEPWQYLLGIFPSYWPMKAYWVHSAGGNMWPWLAGGLIVAAFYLLLLLKRFNRMIYRTN